MSETAAAATRMFETHPAVRNHVTPRFVKLIHFRMEILFGFSFSQLRAPLQQYKCVYRKCLAFKSKSIWHPYVGSLYHQITHFKDSPICIYQKHSLFEHYSLNSQLIFATQDYVPSRPFSTWPQCSVPRLAFLHTFEGDQDPQISAPNP